MRLSYEAGCVDPCGPGDAGLDYASLGELAGSFLARIGADRYNGMKEVSVALSFVSDDDMRGLNARYRSIDEPTDVLSFPLWEEDGVFSPPCGWDVLPLGDVVVSPEFVRRAAGQGDAAYLGEIVLVIVHGTLHLVGYDHDTDEKRDEMWSAQERIRDEYMALSSGYAGLARPDTTEKSEED